ncbi:hypothetical protein PHET_00578 [Paragonimus heterotremus]|uniref:Nuclear pore complex protein Nup88 n=1 Tax=Paragonimus heterotremus TaxID=100268 RepID=A0A8J4X1T1_9TREM|nr:hypothetical protein PHET_00578 [Paragonimus heterotremus]
MRESLATLLKGIDLPGSPAYNSCFVKKIESHCSSSGTTRLFILNEKLGELHVLTQNAGAKECTQTSCILTPMPTLRFEFMYLSPFGRLLALCTRTSIHVLDASSFFQPKTTSESSSSVVKPIYGAFDVADCTNADKFRSEIRRVRWHPLHKDTLVLLTSMSSLIFVQCSRPDGLRGIHCSVLLELQSLTHIDGYRVHEDAGYSSDSDSGSGDDTFCSRSRLDVESALGTSCVDFDFGAVLPRGLTRVKQLGLDAKDCSLYVLLGTGEVLQVAGCLTAIPNRLRVHVRTLQILPPSPDNYGDEFCSLLCISPWTQRAVAEHASAVEVPPDVLVLSNRNGQLFQGVVLNAVCKSPKQSMATDSTPALCLVDIVDLHLHSTIEPLESHDNDPATSTSPSTGNLSQPQSTVNDSDSGPPPLVLEQARATERTAFCGSIPSSRDWYSDFEGTGFQYPCSAYYVVHDTGLHLVCLPWLKDLLAWSQSLLEDPLATSKDGILGRGVREWRSIVTHLICAQLRISRDTADSCGDEVGDFRLAGLIELFLHVGLPDCSLKGTQSYSNQLLIVRAPTRFGDRWDTSELVQLVHFPRTTDMMTVCDLSTGNRPHVQRTRSSERKALRSSIEMPRSEFSLQLRRLLRQDNIRLPLISALSIQTDLSQLQVIRFFLKVTETLRSGSLDRLIRARGFVEQYTDRLAHVLHVHYTDACKLMSERQVLQAKAEQLSVRHAVILERQAMLDKRLAALSCRLAGLTDGPTKAEVAMLDELTQLRRRLQKGLRTWFHALQSKCDRVKKRELEYSRDSNVNLQSNDGRETRLSSAQWRQVSDTLRQQTLEIRALVDLVKSMVPTMRHGNALEPRLMD